MEVILLENIEKLGSRGQIVKVAGGYGRNFLLPKKMAVAATPQNRKWVEQQRVRFLKLEAKEKSEAEELAKLLDGVTLSFKRKSGEKGALFGSVTALDVAEGLSAQGYKIDRRKVHLEQPLKSIGEFDVPVKVHREVTATLKVKVEGELDLQAQAAAEAQAQAKAQARAQAKAPAETPAETKPETK
jgi:large subunit ribosomal protein L9